MNYAENADQFFLMACTVVGYGDHQLIEWWAADKEHAITTFDAWLGSSGPIRLDREFGCAPIDDDAVGPYCHRPAFLIVGFIPVPGRRRRREIA